MNEAQKKAHARLLASLQVRTHWGVSEVTDLKRSMFGTKKYVEAGKRGRTAAGLVIPEFRNLRQKGLRNGKR